MLQPAVLNRLDGRGCRVLVMVTVLLFLQFHRPQASVWAETEFNEQSIVAHHLQIQDGLPNGFVRCVFQDHRHFMWFGDRYGLAFYDGQNFRYHKIGDVHGIFEDSAGMLWVHHANRLSRLDPETDTFEEVLPLELETSKSRMFAVRKSPTSDFLWVFFRANDNDEVLSHVSLFDPRSQSVKETIELPTLAASSRCLVLAERSIWGRGVTSEQIIRFDLEDETTTVFEFDDQSEDGVGGVESVYTKDSKLVWVITAGGVLHRLDVGGERSSFPFLAPRGRSGVVGGGSTPPMCMDDAGRLWVATDGHGLFRFNPETEQFVSFRHAVSDAFSLSSDRISGIYQGRDGVFWVNTQGAGVDCFSPTLPTMQYLTHRPESEQSLAHPVVWAIFRDHAGICWFGHEAGLDRFDPKTGRFRHFEQTSDPNSISVGRNISVVFEDSRKRLWVGSWNGGLNRFDRETESFKHYLHAEDDDRTLQSDRVACITEDHNGTLWVGTSRGLSRYDEQGDCFSRVAISSPDDRAFPAAPFLRTVVELPDEPGVLWLGGWNGLGVVRYDVAQKTFSRFTHDPNDETTISHDTVRFFYPSSDGTVWVGTSDGLNRFDRRTKIFTRFTTADGMPSNAVCGIAEDRERTLWISTSRGLCRFFPEQRKFKKLGRTAGIRIPEFIQRSYFEADDGTLYFGGTNGVNIFHPDDLNARRPSVPIRITDFRLFNRSAGLENSGQKHVWAADKVVLERDENVLSFEFASMDYLERDDAQYRYRLTGFQDNWTIVGSSDRTANYTNLHPGTYTFEVTQAAGDGTWADESASVKLVVRPAWWETNLFRTLLLGSVLLVAVVAYQARIRTYQRQTKRFADLYDALRLEVKEREQAERDFQTVSDKFSRLFQDAREAIYFSTPSGQLLDINPAGVQLLGYADKAEVLGSNTTATLGIDEATQAEFFRRIKEFGFVSDFELSLRRKDGQELFVILSASAVLSPDGRIKEIHGIVYDLTRKKELESQLFQSQKLEAVGTLAAGIAHDFNNLLTVIMANAEIIKETQATNGELAAEHNAILLACNSAARLTNQLLMYSRQENGLRRSSPTSVVKVARDVSELVASTLPKNVNFETSIDASAGHVVADPVQLQQIVMNLCTNAIQAIGSNEGTISVSVAPRVLHGESTTGSFRRLDGAHVELRVRDSGCGIPSDALRRLFDPFYTTREKGTGLGLSVVHGIVEDLGGSIDVSSEVSEGSEFVVFLPQAALPEGNASMNRAASTHVLLAEDEPAVRTAFEKIMRGQGYRVTSAEDGYEAMQLFTASPDAFDVIVTDERMPKMSGLEFARGALSLRADIPVLLVSGHAVDNRFGADAHLLRGFLRKPIKATELHQHLQSVLQRT